MSNARKLNSVEARNVLVFWMVAGPILLILLFLTGFAILFFTLYQQGRGQEITGRLDFIRL